MLGIYRKVLAVFYTYGAFVHAANLLGFGPHRPLALRTLWIAADVVFVLVDAASAFGLWRGRRWGVALFFGAASAQLVMYLGFPQLFSEGPDQRGALTQLVAFHIATVATYLALAAVARLRATR